MLIIIKNNKIILIKINALYNLINLSITIDLLLI